MAKTTKSEAQTTDTVTETPVDTFDGIARDLLAFIVGPNGTSAGIDHAIVVAKARVLALPEAT